MNLIMSWHMREALLPEGENLCPRAVWRSADTWWAGMSGWLSPTGSFLDERQTQGSTLESWVRCVSVRRQAKDQILPTRIIHLPMAFNEKWTHEAIQKYMRSSRREAPYLPSNVDFVAKNNGGLLDLHRS